MSGQTERALHLGAQGRRIKRAALDLLCWNDRVDIDGINVLLAPATCNAILEEHIQMVQLHDCNRKKKGNGLHTMQV